MDFIFIHGAPGVGKSSLAWALQAKLQSPCFEFGWIPEFRVKRNSTISYEEEEGLSFENLTLVVKNYVRHDFHYIIITDLNDQFVQQLPLHFAEYTYCLITLWVEDEAVLKARVLNETRSSGYRNWQAASALNQKIINRALMPHEVRLDSTHLSVEELAVAVVNLVAA